MENQYSCKKCLVSKVTKDNKVILSLFSKPDYEPRGYIIADKAELSKVLASVEKFYNVWNEADKLPF